MKTPTPEEVKDRVAVKHGYRDWNNFITVYFNGETDLMLPDVYKLENEAIRDYAEAIRKESFHDLDYKIKSMRENIMELEKIKDNIEKAEDSLPNVEAWKKYVKDFIDYAYDNPHNEDFHKRKPNSFETYEWMKEQASLVIAKWKEIYNNVNYKDNQTISGLVGELQQKDKEIEELKIKKKYVYDEIREFKNSLERHFNTIDDTIKEVINSLDKIINHQH